jgi:chitinase
VLNKNEIINLILEGKTEEAINILSDFYKVKPPKIKIGLPKGKSFALAVYDPFKNIIYILKKKNICEIPLLFCMNFIML